MLSTDLRRNVRLRPPHSTNARYVFFDSLEPSYSTYLFSSFLRSPLSSPALPPSRARLPLNPSTRSSPSTDSKHTPTPRLPSPRFSPPSPPLRFPPSFFLSFTEKSHIPLQIVIFLPSFDAFTKKKESKTNKKNWNAFPTLLSRVPIPLSLRRHFNPLVSSSSSSLALSTLDSWVSLFHFEEFLGESWSGLWNRKGGAEIRGDSKGLGGK